MVLESNLEDDDDLDEDLDNIESTIFFQFLMLFLGTVIITTLPIHLRVEDEELERVKSIEETGEVIPQFWFELDQLYTEK